MTNLITNLPLELQKLIFELLDHRHLVNCRLTNLKWYHVLKPLVYREIVLDKRLDIWKLINNLRTQPELSKLVETIDFTNNPLPRNSEILEGFMGTCTNVKRIRSDILGKEVGLSDKD